VYNLHLFEWSSVAPPDETRLAPVYRPSCDADLVARHLLLSARKTCEIYHRVGQGNIYIYFLSYTVESLENNL
jgi:hypothetical protein